jgi:hypothetical protein
LLATTPKVEELYQNPKVVVVVGEKIYDATYEA